eukprot:m.25402 g.25402  ORF g.25402 m.25402 type:complete len:425 (+) comp11593_c0_seq1:205-1479(+)
MNWLFLFYQAVLGAAFLAAVIALFSPNWVDSRDLDYPSEARRWDTVGLLLHCRHRTLSFADSAVIVTQDRTCVVYDQKDEADFPSQRWRDAAIVFGVGTAVLLVALSLALTYCIRPLRRGVHAILCVLTLIAFSLLLSGVLLWADDLGALSQIPASTSGLCPGADSFNRGSCDLSYGAVLAFIAVALALMASIICILSGCNIPSSSKSASQQQASSGTSSTASLSSPVREPDSKGEVLPVLRLDSDTEDGYSDIHPDDSESEETMSVVQVVAEAQVARPLGTAVDSAVPATPTSDPKLWWDTEEDSEPPLFPNPTAAVIVRRNKHYVGLRDSGVIDTAISSDVPTTKGPKSEVGRRRYASRNLSLRQCTSPGPNSRSITEAKAAATMPELPGSSTCKQDSDNDDEDTPYSSPTLTPYSSAERLF